MRRTNSSLLSFIFRARCRKILTAPDLKKVSKRYAQSKEQTKSPRSLLCLSVAAFSTAPLHTHTILSLSLFAPAYPKKIASVSKAIHSTLAAEGFRQRPSQSADDLIHHLIISLLFPASNKCGHKQKSLYRPTQ